MWLGFLRCPLFSRMSEGQGKGEEETFPTGPLASLNHSFLPDTNGGLPASLPSERVLSQGMNASGGDAEGDHFVS